MKSFRHIVYFLVTCMIVACDIKDDIPYPIVRGMITEFEVEGQCGADGGTSYSTQIDKDNRSIKIYVNDLVDVTQLQVTKIGLAGTSYNPDVDYTDSPSIDVNPESCIDYSSFPKSAFSKPLNGQNTRVNFSSPVKFNVHTYQDYEWTVNVTQVIHRDIEVENQVGKAVIDPHPFEDTYNAIIYVNRNQDLKKLKVHKFDLVGPNATVFDNPTKYEYYDFSEVRYFVVQTAWGKKQIWRVAVYKTDDVVATTATAFARNYDVTISGTKPNGISPRIEYKASGTNTWSVVPSANISVEATTYTTTVAGLSPSTKYEYKVSAGESELEPQEFTTIAIQQLPNASFDDWHTDVANSKLFCPWAQDGTSFWDTGNRGATTVGNSNSIPTDDSSTGSGMAAYLESKYIVIKFAAGNIFTGTYLKTDGTNGILGFGRPFTGFPTKMSFDYKYKSTIINKEGDDAYKHLIGRPDSCNIYVALWHVEEDEYEDYQGDKYPLVIRTKPGQEQNLFSVDDPRVIAYGQFTKGSTVNSWTSETISINYKNTQKAPTHILIVASSSKYGDFFTGGVGSTLVLDNMKLIYE